MINRTHRFFLLFFSLVLVLLMTACTGGDRGFVPVPETPEEEKPADILITAGGVKGPLINAEVNIYKFELDKGAIHEFNSALNKWFELLEENEVSITGNELSIGSVPVSGIIDNLQQSFRQFGFTTELKKLKQDIAAATSFSEADTLVSDYLDSIETNEKVLRLVESIKEKASTLASYKSEIKATKSLTDEIAEAESFSSARSILLDYRANEKAQPDSPVGAQKLVGFDLAIAALDAYRAKSSSFGLTAIRNTFEKDIYDVFLQRPDIQNSPFSRQNIIDLNTNLSEASTVEDAKDALQNSFDIESNVELKTAISILLSNITTLDDFKFDLLGRESLFHDFSVKDAILAFGNANNSLTSLQVLYESVSSLFAENLEDALRDSFIVFDETKFVQDSNNVEAKENLLSFGVTNEQGLLQGLKINQYRGFVYMEVITKANTIDLNSGQAPIFDKLETIFHTDSILGNGSENSEDKTLFFILNGVVQRDSNGKLISDRTLLSSNTTDELLEIRPHFFATPLTQIGLGVAIEKMKTLDVFLSDGDLDGKQDKFLSKNALNRSLTDASKLLIETLGIGMDSNQDIFTSSALRLPEMKVSKTDELAAIQQRLTIENFSSFIQELRTRTNLSGSRLLELVSQDLVDNQLDARAFSEPVETLLDIPEYLFLLQSDPGEKFLPDTNTPVSDVFYVMNDELATTQPNLQLSDFTAVRNELIIGTPAGGRDTDGDNVLDNDDKFPRDPLQSNNLVAGDAGIWSVEFDASEFGYMPFKEDFIFSLNKEQIEGTCSNLPCIGLGDISTAISAQYSLIQAPSNHDFVLTSFDRNNTIGFTAFATVPGNYLIKATFSSSAQSEQRFEIIVPVQVIDPKSIELKFEPENPQPGKTVKVQFKATKGLCSLYNFCTELNVNLDDNIPDFIDISFLGDIFSVEQTIARDDVLINYSGVDARQGNNETSNLSNLEVNDTLNVNVLFSAGVRGFIAKSTSSNAGEGQDSDSDGVADANDLFPEDANCSLGKDGILDSNLDGEINNLDTPTCFTTFFEEASDELDVSFLNETWFYKPSWHYIIRKNKFLSGFNGLIKLPTLTGTKLAIEHFKVDPINKRVYFGYKNSAIDYFSLESQELKTFQDGVNFTRINSLNLVSTYLLVEYDLGLNNFEGVLYNANGQLAEIRGADNFPKPLAAISLEIDGLNFLSATNNLLSIDWQLERENEDQSISNVPIQLSNDKRTLLSGQTLFSDVIKLAFTFSTADNRDVQIRQNLFVLNIDDIDFEKDNFDPNEPLNINFFGFDPSILSSSNRSIMVNWSKNDENSDSLQFVLSDFNYPFTLETSNFVFGDIIQADVVLNHGNEQLLIKRLNAVILGELRLIRPIIDADKTVEDPATLKVSFTVAKPSTNDDFFNTDSFTPVWRINGQVIPGENGLTFPQLSTTRLSFGDSISVNYLIHINGLTIDADETAVVKLNPDPALSQFELLPKVAEVGEDISLDLSNFTDETLGNLVPKWRINNILDESVTDFSYPSNKLNYGDQVELLLVPRGSDLSDAYNHIALGSVGINLSSLAQQVADPLNDLDSDQDGSPNFLDSFRHDERCSVITEGNPDDIDGDSIPDLIELGLHNTNPNLVDTDSDGLSDWHEINVSLTDPLNSDSDADGYLDGVEIDLGTDPLNVSSPNNVCDDNDFDGLCNEDELTFATKVNIFDTDADGLSDWFELNVSLTDPLNPDSDADGLSDGLEVRITKTNPLLSDTDGDGLSDGLEILVGLNPLLVDSDNNAINDIDESGFDFNQQLPGIINITDLPNHQVVIDHRKIVAAGTCFNTFIADKKPQLVAISHEMQVSNLSDQQVAFSSPDWAQVLRYDAKNKQYLQSIDLSPYTNVELTSLEYDVDDLNIIYLGFSDGTIRAFNAQTNLITDLFIAEEGFAVTKLIDQGALLLAEQVTENQQIVHSAFDTTVNNTTLAKAKWNADYSYNQSVWFNNRSQLLIIDADNDPNNFIRETFDGSQANPLINIEQISSISLLDGPVFFENIEGNEVLRFGSGQSYNLSSNTWLSQQLAPFSYGISHQSHRVVTLKNSSLLEMTTLDTIDGDNFWRFTTQLDQPEIISVIPVGFHLLAITSKSPKLNEPSEIAFQSIILGDEDGNNLPDWWQRLSNSLTVAEFNNYQLTSDVAIPDFLNGDPDIDNTVTPPVLVDSDGDGICDHWEVNLFGTIPLSADSDNDGASDSQELGLTPQNPLDCSLLPVWSIKSDPLNPDTDDDGLLDGQEFFVYFTNPLLADTDSDGLTDWQEINITLTNPLIANISGIDSDGDRLSDAEELNQYHTNPNNMDTDSDGLSDDKEVKDNGSNPNSWDSDGDLIPDGIEVGFLETNPSSVDSDGDGLSDSDEVWVFAFEVDENGLLTNNLVQVGANTDIDLNNKQNNNQWPEPQAFEDNSNDESTEQDQKVYDLFDVADDTKITGRLFVKVFSDPNKLDTDGDGLNDLDESAFAYEYSEAELEAFLNVGIIPATKLNPRSNDTDGDGICDVWEVTLYGTNPAEADTDFDRLTDAEELGITVASGEVDCTNPPVINPISDPVINDTDGDNILDGDEVKILFTDPMDKDSNDSGINDDKEDFDGDGLNNFQEVYLTKSDPFNPDENLNGISDALDDFDGDGLTNLFEILNSKTDPLNVDTNGNGLSDKEEYDLGLSNSPSGDTDDDGISDVDEIKIGTDPLNPDSDDDGIPDGEEITLRFDPLNPDSDHDFLKDGDDNDGILRALEHDSDGDGIPDGIEVHFLRSSPKELDNDNDGIADGDEVWVYAFKTTPAADPNAPPVVSENLLNIGQNKDIPLNSKRNHPLWPAPQPFAANGLDRFVFDLYDMKDDSLVVGKLFIQLYSDPTKQDSDGDGLLDPTEFAIETASGNGFDLTLNSGSFAPRSTNAANFKLSDPLNVDSNSAKDTDGDGLPDWYEIKASLTDPLKADTDDNGIPDGQENPDADLLTNLQEMRFGSDPHVSDGIEALAGLPVFDTDGDGLPDLYEIRVFNTSPNIVDTDGNGISDADEDADGDGLSNLEEIILGLNPLLADADTLSKDTDNDGLLDYIELLITFTNPNEADTNGNGISDYDEDTDNDGLSNGLEVLLGSDPIVRNISVDRDGDGLTDFQETAITLTDINLLDSNSNGILDGNEDFDGDSLSNLQEMLLNNDPFEADILDGQEDVDGDLLINLLDQNNQETDVINPDTDGDGILDGVEVLILGTNPNMVDTDEDGIADSDELVFDQDNNIREIASNEACLDSETRLSGIAGKDYCISVRFNSFPTISDSDNDGIPDRIVNEDSSVTIDHFPLDATCHKETDGFENLDLGREQCFSSWMSDFNSIDMIKSAKWLSNTNQGRAEVIFHMQGWDKIVRYNVLTQSYSAPVLVDTNETVIAIDISSLSKSLYIFYANGKLDRFDLEAGTTQTIDTFMHAGLSPSALLAIDSGEIILQFVDVNNQSSLFLHDLNGAQLDSLSGLEVDIDGALFKCANADCDSTGTIYSFVVDSSGLITNLANIGVDLQTKTFGSIITSNTLAQFNELKGPIRLSESGDKVYLGSGQILELDLQDSDHTQDLSITHLGKTYSEYYDFTESSGHFVGVIDFDLSGTPGAPIEPATQNGLIAKDLSSPNKYLLPPITLEERILGLFPYTQTNLLEIAIVSRLSDRILIENLGASDQDNDGMPGIYEKFFGLNDENPNDKFEDPDNDGLVNIEEYIYGRDPWDDRLEDPDNDGLINQEEKFFGTDPFNNDTDGDGRDDLYEVLNDKDPLDPLDF